MLLELDTLVKLIRVLLELLERLIRVLLELELLEWLERLIRVLLELELLEWLIRVLEFDLAELDELESIRCWPLLSYSWKNYSVVLCY